MKPRFPHRRAAIPSRPPDEPGEEARPLLIHERACCCPARPVVTVVMPPTAMRPHPVELLLCGHHYRVSRDALAAAGAAVYDDTGALLASAAGEHQFAGPEPAHAVPRS